MMVSRQPADSGHEAPDASGRRIVLTMPLADRLATILGLPALGLLLGLLLPPFSRWLIGLSVPIPMGVLFRLLGAVDAPWEIAICLAAGLLLGLATALLTMAGAMTVTLTGTDLRIDKNDLTRVIARTDIDAVFLDGNKLVVLDRESRHLIRDIHDIPPAALADAFRAHQYPWRDADPYAELYRRWEAGTPDLSAPVNAVLAARETALRKKARKEIHDLRAAVEQLGFTVRDEGTRQYWRPLVRS